MMDDLLLLAKRKSSGEDASNSNKKKKKNKDKAISTAPVESNYPYPVVDDDHCESPVEAYQDIEQFLIVIAKSLGKTKDTLRIFDPYFCEGKMKERLASIGFTNVTNEKKDFYESITNETLPEYDVLVTNPPYSGSHMERLVQYCNDTNGQKPWFLLMPNYVYTKDYYSKIFEHNKGPGGKPFYVTPGHGRRYLYTTPKGRRQEKSSKYTSPFPTFWYCQMYDKRDSLLSQAAAVRSSMSKAAKLAPAATTDTTDTAVSGPASDETVETKAAAAPKKPTTIVVALSDTAIPLEIAPDNDSRKKKLRNNQKRSKNKQRQKDGGVPKK